MVTRLKTICVCCALVRNDTGPESVEHGARPIDAEPVDMASKPLSNSDPRQKKHNHDRNGTSGWGLS